MYPTLVHFGNFLLPTFGVLAAVGLMLGLGLSLRTARLAGLAPEAVWDAGMFGVVAAFVLSRLLLVLGDVHGFLTYPRQLLAVPSLTGWGMLATAVATGVWLRQHRLPLLAVLDAWAPCGALVWGFLALGHFAEGSDPGLPWRFGLRMPGMTTPLVPVALYAAVVAWGLGVGLMGLAGKSGRGITSAWGVIGAGVGEFGLGFLRQPDLSGVTTLLDPGQWGSLGMVAVGVVLLGAARMSLPFSDEGVANALERDSVAMTEERTSAAEAGEQRRDYGTAEAVPLSNADAVRAATLARGVHDAV